METYQKGRKRNLSKLCETCIIGIGLISIGFSIGVVNGYIVAVRSTKPTVSAKTVDIPLSDDCTYDFYSEGNIPLRITFTVNKSERVLENDKQEIEVLYDELYQ